MCSRSAPAWCTRRGARFPHLLFVLLCLSLPLLYKGVDGA